MCDDRLASHPGCIAALFPILPRIGSTLLYDTRLETVLRLILVRVTDLNDYVHWLYTLSERALRLPHQDMVWWGEIIFTVSIRPVAVECTCLYLSLSLLAFMRYGCLVASVRLFHISPSRLATSPMPKLGFWALILGRCSEQNRKKPDLCGTQKQVNCISLPNTFIYDTISGSSCVAVWPSQILDVHDVRWSFWGIGVFLLALLSRHVAHHLLVITYLVLLGHLLKFGLLFLRHGLGYITSGWMYIFIENTYTLGLERYISLVDKLPPVHKQNNNLSHVSDYLVFV